MYSSKSAVEAPRVERLRNNECEQGAQDWDLSDPKVAGALRRVVKTMKPKSFLKYALETDNVQFVDFVLSEFRVNPSVYFNKQTPLHMAARRNNQDMVRLLLKYGASVNAQTLDTFETPLHLAESSTMRSLLIVNGADTTIEDKDNKSPLAAFIKQWRREIGYITE